MSANPVAIIFVMRALGRVFPARPLAEVTPLSFEELKVQYRARDRLGNLLGFLCFLLLGVGYFFLLQGIASWCYGPLVRAPFFLAPHPIELGVWAGFLSLFSVGYLTLLGLRLVLGKQEYTIYSTYGCYKTLPDAPFSVAKVLGVFFWVFFPLVLVGTVLRIDNYTAFTDKTIISSPFLSFGKTNEHPYSAVQGLYEVRGYHARFEDVVAPFMVIVFNDGQRWESEHGTGGDKLDGQRAALQKVARASGKPIVRVDFIEEIEKK